MTSGFAVIIVVISLLLLLLIGLYSSDSEIIKWIWRGVFAGLVPILLVLSYKLAVKGKCTEK